MLTKRKDIYHLRRRVPARYRDIEPRNEFHISLGTPDRHVAERKAEEVWADLERAWEAKLAGDTTDAEVRFAAANNLAKARGFVWMPASKVAQLPIGQLVERIEKTDGAMDAAALLGAVDVPKITVGRAYDIFIEHTQDERANWDGNQIRIWTNARKRSVDGFIKAMGRDMPIEDIDADVALEFRDWWWKRIQSRSVKAATANREIGQLSRILNTVIKIRRLGIDPPLSGISFKQGKQAVRLPFSTEWIRSKILAPGALSELNKEARCILLGMINTGYRPSEAYSLLPAQIRLDTDVPHIHISPEFRDLKTDHSERVIPLAGVSLEAFRECPEGFPRYRGKTGPMNLINNYLRRNGLAETPKHTLYGLRHSFEDRLLEAGVDERLRRDFLGHKLDRERYGQGGSLDFRLKAIQAISL